MTDDTFYREAAKRLKRERWTLLLGLADQLPSHLREDRRRLVEDAKIAPVDRYCPEGSRQRYFHKGFVVDGHFLPDQPLIDEALGPVVSFDQGEANPEFAGEIRMVPIIPPRVWNNRAYRELQERCLMMACDALDLPSGTPFAWESHLIRLVATPGNPAVGTPDVIHFDDANNRMVTFIIVIERSDVVGGINLITARRCAGMASATVPANDIYFEGIIGKPFDGYGFIDSDVAHYVSGIDAAPGAASGARTILIFDFVKLIREPISFAASVVTSMTKAA
jgi:hypothetical protein